MTKAALLRWPLSQLGGVSLSMFWAAICAEEQCMAGSSLIECHALGRPGSVPDFEDFRERVYLLSYASVREGGGLATGLVRTS